MKFRQHRRERFGPADAVEHHHGLVARVSLVEQTAHLFHARHAAAQHGDAPSVGSVAQHPARLGQQQALVGRTDDPHERDERSRDDGRKGCDEHDLAGG